MIPLDVVQPSGVDFAKNKIKSFKLLQRDFSKSNIIACYMALFSCFIANLIYLYIPLIQYTDHSFFESFRLFVGKQDNRVAVFYYCDIIHCLIFYLGILLSLFFHNLMLWEIMRNWISVGLMLTILAIPFTFKYCFFKITSSLINMVCLRIRISYKFEEQ